MQEHIIQGAPRFAEDACWCRYAREQANKWVFQRAIHRRDVWHQHLGWYPRSDLKKCNALKMISWKFKTIRLASGAVYFKLRNINNVVELLASKLTLKKVFRTLKKRKRKITKQFKVNERIITKKEKKRKDFFHQDYKTASVCISCFRLIAL